MDNLLQLEKLTAIQFTLEHTGGGPSLAVTLPVVRRILAHKPLILVALDIESIDRCLAELPTDGLCVTLGVSGPTIPAEATDWLAQQMKEYLALVIPKLGQLIKLAHFSDNDSTQAYHYEPGRGTIDFRAVLRSLHRTGFDGTIVVDISGVPDIVTQAVRARDCFEGLIAEVAG